MEEKEKYELFAEIMEWVRFWLTVGNRELDKGKEKSGISHDKAHSEEEEGRKHWKR